MASPVVSLRCTIAGSIADALQAMPLQQGPEQRSRLSPLPFATCFKPFPALNSTSSAAGPTSRPATLLRAVASPVRSASERPGATDPIDTEPTPVVPTNYAMVSFLRTYGSVLERASSGDVGITGDSLAAAGTMVVDRVHVGLLAMLGHPVHGMEAQSEWRPSEAMVERCLLELEKDIDGFRDAHTHPPPPSRVRLAAIHCFDAARLIHNL
ncbi:hypothetical protein CLOP_g9088 [Closterium sp. NIES-67]|nr:hypothetical protein CLOP_g9088 [Closterium sp. NIES-67]